MVRAIDCTSGLLAGLLMAAPAMARSIAIGNSLAVGFGQASHVETIARVGISSCVIARMVPSEQFDTALLSAGTNDPPGRCVEQVRTAFTPATSFGSCQLMGLAPRCSGSPASMATGCSTTPHRVAVGRIRLATGRCSDGRHGHGRSALSGGRAALQSRRPQLPRDRAKVSREPQRGQRLVDPRQGASRQGCRELL